MQHIQHVSQVIQKPSSQAGSLHTKQRKKIMYHLLSFINLNTYLHANNCMISS